MEPKIMSDWAAKDSRSFKAWQSGTDDGRVAKFLAWAKRNPGLSEEALVRNYKDRRLTLPQMASKAPSFGERLLAGVTNWLLIPASGLLVGVWLIQRFF